MGNTRLFTALTVAAVIALCGATAPATAFASPQVNVQVYGYLPAPPGVHIYLSGGRPYYIERHRRVYVERDRRHGRDRHRHGDEYREREDRGHGHDNGRGRGHGRD